MIFGRMNRQTGCLLLLLLVVLFLGSCADDDDDDQADDDSVDDDDNGDDDDWDAVTSASPERDSTVLASAHSGWGNADCYTCHEEVHLEAFDLGECATCHGVNGAPQRPDGHPNSLCTSCHSDSHTGVGFKEQHCTACHTYNPDVQCPATETFDVVVIGAGGGGLAAAAALAKAGMSVALLEKHSRVGGYMNRFHRGPYEFEISLHAYSGLGDPATVPDLVRLGIFDQLEPVKADPLYTSYFPGGDIYAIPADIDAYRAYLKEKFPHEAAGIDAMFDEMALMGVLLDTVTRLAAYFTFEDLFALLADVPGTLRLARYVIISLQDFMIQYISDPELIGLWSQLVVFLGDGPSKLQAVFFQAMWNSYHNNGYYYLKGGSASFTNAMADVILQNGGAIMLNSLATKIVIDNGRAVQVQTENDGCYDARYVVSNANAPDTLLNMVGEQHLPADYTAKLKNMEICVPTTLQIYMGVDQDYRDAFNGTHELMINETYDQDQNYAYVYDADPTQTPFIIANYSVVDPTVAPEGKNVLVMATYLPMEWEDTWRWNQGYAPYLSFKESVAQVYIDRMEAYLPGLGDHIEVLEIGTPVTNYAFTLNPLGSIYGWRNIPSQATILRLKQQTPIDNLILAGAWTFPGGGQATVIGSGCTAADMVLEKEAGALR